MTLLGKTEEIGDIRVKPNAWAMKQANSLYLNSASLGLVYLYNSNFFFSILTSLHYLTQIIDDSIGTNRSGSFSVITQLNVVLVHVSVAWYLSFPTVGGKFTWNIDFKKCFIKYFKFTEKKHTHE